MEFKIRETALRNGTEKAFMDEDQYHNHYFIPRSLIKIKERIPGQFECDTVLLVEIPDWIIRKNCIPIFTLTDLHLVR